MYIPFTMILIYIIIRFNTLQLAFKGNYPTIIQRLEPFLLPTLLKTCLLHQEKQVWWLIALHSAPFSLAWGESHVIQEKHVQVTWLSYFKTNKRTNKKHSEVTAQLKIHCVLIPLLLQCKLETPRWPAGTQALEFHSTSWWYLSLLPSHPVVDYWRFSWCIVIRWMWVIMKISFDF